MFTEAEKVTYTDGINGSVILNGNAGDYSLRLRRHRDDDDRQRRVRERPLLGRPTLHRLRPRRRVRRHRVLHLHPRQTLHGLRFAATINGGTGDDTFEIFATSPRSSSTARPATTPSSSAGFVEESENTSVNAGVGHDYIEYAMNAPSRSTGARAMTSSSSSAQSSTTCTSSPRTGSTAPAATSPTSTSSDSRSTAWRATTKFYIVSTNPIVETKVYGGLGSDRVEVGAQAPPVQADDLLGHTGLITNSVETRHRSVTGPASRSTVSARRSSTTTRRRCCSSTVGGSITVDEATSTVTGTIRIRPTYVATSLGTRIEVTLAAPAVDPTSTSRYRTSAVHGPRLEPGLRTPR